MTKWHLPQSGDPTGVHPKLVEILLTLLWRWIYAVCKVYFELAKSPIIFLNSANLSREISAIIFDLKKDSITYLERGAKVPTSAIEVSHEEQNGTVSVLIKLRSHFKQLGKCEILLLVCHSYFWVWGRVLDIRGSSEILP